MSELKPCPFCGGEATILTSEPSEANHNNGAIHSAVACLSLGCQVMPYPKLWHVNDDEAIKAWNHRPVENKIKAQGIRDAINSVAYKGDMQYQVIRQFEEYANKLEGES